MGEGGITAGTSLRLVQGSQYWGQSALEAESQGVMRPLICADSWFGSIKLVESLKCMYRKLRQPTARDHRTYTLCVDKERGNNVHGPEAICSIKTNTGLFPHEELKKEMEPFPSGAYLVMECLAPGTNVNLVAIGYKSKNTETTEPGFPYIARFPDEYGNVRERCILRPKCLTTYFRVANLIDMHNHPRQGVLRLEMLWRTPNPWFRLITTIIGITVVDCYLATRYHLGGKQFPVSKGIEGFADCMAWDLAHNEFNNNIDRRGQVHPSIAANAVTAGGDGGQQESMASITEQATNFARQMLQDAFRHQLGGASSGGGTRSLAPISVIDVQSTQQSISVVSPTETDAGTSIASSSFCQPCNSTESVFTHRPIPNPDTVTDSDGKTRPCARRCKIC